MLAFRISDMRHIRTANPTYASIEGIHIHTVLLPEMRYANVKCANYVKVENNYILLSSVSGETVLALLFHP